MSACVEMKVACPDADIAARIADRAIGARLAACVNIAGPITSVYWWDGAIETATEVEAVFKTRDERAEALADLIRTEHPYDTPAITWHETACDRATAAWLEAETTAEA